MAEQISLDPAQVATGRNEYDITPWISAEGIDWGDGAITAYMADQSRGSSPVDYRIPNRTITMPLALKTVGGTTFTQIREIFQAKAALFQREGGWLKRITSAGTVYADIVNATLALPGSWSSAHKNFDAEAQLTLEAIPDFYGNEIDLGDNVTTTATELVFNLGGIKGNHPGRCRIVVDEDDADSQLGLLWGMRYYDAAATARLAYEAELMTPLDTSVVATLTGASGGGTNNSVRHANLSFDWTPVLSTDLLAGGALTHKGSYRVWARVQSEGLLPPQLRLVWDVGDMASPVENAPATPFAYALMLVDLGEVRLDPVPVGTHRWRGQIQGKKRATSGTSAVNIDKVWLVPLDESAGSLRAPFETSSGVTLLSARDDFTQTSGALAGKTATVGGVWGGGGDANDFAVVDAEDLVERTALSDAANTGRFNPVGASMTAVAAQVDVWVSAAEAAYIGLLVRYSSSTVFAMSMLTFTPGDVHRLGLWFMSGGYAPFNPTDRELLLSPQTWYTQRVVITADGRWAIYVFPAGSQPTGPIVGGQHSFLATAGSHAAGQSGLFDHYLGSIPVTRRFRNFRTWVPTLDAVLHPSQSAELRTDGMFREDSTGTAYGPVGQVLGDLPRLPPAGLEGRIVEVFLKGSRGDLGVLPDNGIDDISARAFYRPSWLTVPGT